MLNEKFPPIGPYKTERVTTYIPDGPTERIHLYLIDKIYLDIREPIVQSEQVEGLAKKIFDDIDFRFYGHQEEGNVIQFKPYGLDKYVQNYLGHYIAVHEPLKFPKMTISTANRGAFRLHERQRQKYFDFVVDLNGIFLDEAKKFHEKHK